VSTHDHFRELIEAYAIGSLDAAECAELEAHLASGCADCVKALEEARWLVSQLAYLAPNAQPSDMLKGRLLQTVRAEAAAGGQPRQEPVHSTGIPWWLWAGVAALLIFSVYSAWNEQQLRSAVNNLQQQAEAQRAERQKTGAGPSRRQNASPRGHDLERSKIKEDHAATQRPKHAAARGHVAPELGLCVRGWKVPSPGEKRMLQLWLISKKSGKPCLQ